MHVYMTQIAWGAWLLTMISLAGVAHYTRKDGGWEVFFVPTALIVTGIMSPALVLSFLWF